jgi:hypothetical protein
MVSDPDLKYGFVKKSKSGLKPDFGFKSGFKFRLQFIKKSGFEAVSNEN